MAEPILDDLLDMMPDEIEVRKALSGVADSGEEQYEPTGTKYRARISGTTRIVDGTTRHIVKASLATTDPLKNEDLYILPERFAQREFYGGVEVKPVSDENGPHHVVVYF